MTFSVFSTLYREAMNEPDIDMFIGSVGFPEYLGSVSDEDAYLILTTIHTFANGSFRDIRNVGNPGTDMRELGNGCQHAAAVCQVPDFLGSILFDAGTVIPWRGVL